MININKKSQTAVVTAVMTAVMTAVVTAVYRGGCRPPEPGEMLLWMQANYMSCLLAPRCTYWSYPSIHSKHAGRAPKRVVNQALIGPLGRPRRASRTSPTGLPGGAKLSPIWGSKSDQKPRNPAAKKKSKKLLKRLELIR